MPIKTILTIRHVTIHGHQTKESRPTAKVVNLTKEVAAQGDAPPQHRYRQSGRGGRTSRTSAIWPKLLTCTAATMVSVENPIIVGTDQQNDAMARDLYSLQP